MPGPGGSVAERPEADWRSYGHLLAAHVLALAGTGVATVALALLAYRIAGGSAAAVLGIAFGLKVAAYVLVAPLAAAVSDRVPRWAVLVAMDLVRAGVAFLLPYATEVWHVYLLIFVFQVASAVFVPLLQASLPDVLPAPEDYLRALSISRLVGELESVVSPVLAAALLLVLSGIGLFAATVGAFLLSAALLLRVRLPDGMRRAREPFGRRALHGMRIFAATPRLRALATLNAAAAAGGALVTVATVVIVQGQFGGTQRETAIALALFGAGSAIGALAVPRMMAWMTDRVLMIGGAALVAAALAVAAAALSYASLLPLWALLGLGGALAQTPAGALLRRSGTPEDKPALYASQLALSHCWLLLFYPLAGWAGSSLSVGAACGLFAAIAGVAGLAALRLWPASDAARVQDQDAAEPLVSRT